MSQPQQGSCEFWSQTPIVPNPYNAYIGRQGVVTGNSTGNIILGFNATIYDGTSYTALIGGISNTTGPKYGINDLIVTGRVGSSPFINNIITLRAFSYPAVGEIGLAVVHNDGVFPLSKVIKATSGAVPGGAYTLYVDP